MKDASQEKVTCTSTSTHCSSPLKCSRTKKPSGSESTFALSQETPIKLSWNLKQPPRSLLFPGCSGVCTCLQRSGAPSTLRAILLCMGYMWCKSVGAQLGLWNSSWPPFQSTALLALLLGCCIQQKNHNTRELTGKAFSSLTKPWLPACPHRSSLFSSLTSK